MEIHYVWWNLAKLGGTTCALNWKTTPVLLRLTNTILFNVLHIYVCDVNINVAIIDW